MKKIMYFTIIIMGAISLFGCSNKMSGMPRYDAKECYFSKGVQDYADYCIYSYNSESIKKFEEHDKFEAVSTSDIELLKKYFANFDEWAKEEDYYNSFEFNIHSQVKEGDYFYIYIKDGYEEFSYYDVYYLDTEQLKMYFIHLNT